MVRHGEVGTTFLSNTYHHNGFLPFHIHAYAILSRPILDNGDARHLGHLYSHTQHMECDTVSF